MSHLFIGIRIPNHIKQILKSYAEEYKPTIPLKQWTHQDDFHITLAFLGSIENGDYGKLKTLLKEIAKDYESFTLTICDTGVFGKEDTPRVLWAGLNMENALFKLQEKIRNASLTSGYQLDKRPYRPHITLGKKWDGKRPVLFIPKSLEGNLTWIVKEFIIFEIHPKDTPKYKVKEAIELKV